MSWARISSAARRAALPAMNVTARVRAQIDGVGVAVLREDADALEADAEGSATHCASIVSDPWPSRPPCSARDAAVHVDLQMRRRLRQLREVMGSASPRCRNRHATPIPRPGAASGTSRPSARPRELEEPLARAVRRDPELVDRLRVRGSRFRSRNSIASMPAFSASSSTITSIAKREFTAPCPRIAPEGGLFV